MCVLCLIVIPLPPGENPFAVKMNDDDNNNNNNNNNNNSVSNVTACGREGKVYYLFTVRIFLFISNFYAQDIFLFFEKILAKLPYMSHIF
jgi:hypothetical protein